MKMNGMVQIESPLIDRGSVKKIFFAFLIKMSALNHSISISLIETGSINGK
jgi:hypothetical protein